VLRRFRGTVEVGLYNWLLNNKWFGNYIKNYLERKEIPLIVKVLSISLIWITIGCPAIFIVHSFIGKIILILIATGVSIHIISLRTLRKRKELVQGD